MSIEASWPLLKSIGAFLLYLLIWVGPKFLQRSSSKAVKTDQKFDEALVKADIQNKIQQRKSKTPQAIKKAPTPVTSAKQILEPMSSYARSTFDSSNAFDLPSDLEPIALSASESLALIDEIPTCNRLQVLLSNLENSILAREILEPPLSLRRQHKGYYGSRMLR